MASSIAKFILKLFGWKLVYPDFTKYKKAVMVGGPHTSNIDGFISVLCFFGMPGNFKYAAKKELFKAPFGWLVKLTGGIPIDRSPKDPNAPRKSLTEAMAQLYDQYEELIIAISFEGTRKRNDKWKTGFYYLAKMAEVPILLGFIDYKEKTCGISEIAFTVTGNIENDMKKIVEFYASINPYNPENFALDERYV